MNISSLDRIRNCFGHNPNCCDWQVSILAVEVGFGGGFAFMKHQAVAVC